MVDIKWSDSFIHLYKNNKCLNIIASGSFIRFVDEEITVVCCCRKCTDWLSISKHPVYNNISSSISHWLYRVYHFQTTRIFHILVSSVQDWIPHTFSASHYRKTALHTGSFSLQCPTIKTNSQVIVSVPANSSSSVERQIPPTQTMSDSL